MWTGTCWVQVSRLLLSGEVPLRELSEMRARLYLNLGLVYDGLMDPAKHSYYIKKSIYISEYVPCWACRALLQLSRTHFPPGFCWLLPLAGGLLGPLLLQSQADGWGRDGPGCPAEGGEANSQRSARLQHSPRGSREDVGLQGAAQRGQARQEVLCGDPRLPLPPSPPGRLTCMRTSTGPISTWATSTSGRGRPLRPCAAWRGPGSAPAR